MAPQYTYKRQKEKGDPSNFLNFFLIILHVIDVSTFKRTFIKKVNGNFESSFF